MSEDGKPGPKPLRLYVRLAVLGEPEQENPPSARTVTAFRSELERVGRMVAHGPLTRPRGDLIILRARGLEEAARALRSDPFRSAPAGAYRIYEWDPRHVGGGVNLDPPPPLGSGRLTELERISVIVRDQSKALTWYRGVLGLGLREYDPESGYLELSLGRGAAALSLVAPRKEWGEPYYSEALQRVGTRTGIAFATDSIPALQLRLEHAGVRITQLPEEQPWGGVTIRFVDPDGNEFLAFQRASPGPSRSARGRPRRPRTPVLSR